MRLSDNPALYHAAQSGQGLIACYIQDPEEDPAPGGASRWWLHHSLASLEKSLQKIGLKLIYRQGPASQQIPKILKESGATHLYYNRCYEPAIRQRDTALKQSLKAQGFEVQSFNGSLLGEPWELAKQDGSAYQVFTPFWKNLLQSPPPPAPWPRPKSLRAAQVTLKGCSLEDLELLPKIAWDQGFYRQWSVGETAAQQQLKSFLKNTAQQYPAGRDFPAQEATSQLAAHLHFGEISPRQIWQQSRQNMAELDAADSQNILEFLRQIAWRDFAYHLLYYFPHTATQPLREKFKKFPWKKNKQDLKKWQQGQTGFPIVDAGMQQLWQTGTMHNRVRMIVASFLVKDLLIPWQEGAAWFWDTLVDADLANNSLGWQWVAGCGADASPYFRIFNPITQAQKFDPQGAYIKKWLPQLKDLAPPWIFKPWEAPEEILKQAQVKLGKDYPKPMVDHALARQEALAAYKSL